MEKHFEFKPFDESSDLELVLEWLVETKQLTPDTKVDVASERKYYFEDVRKIQSRDVSFSSILYLNDKPIGYLCTFQHQKQKEISWRDFCYLVPDARGTEASELIVSRAVNLAKEHGCTAIRLNVHHMNHRARAFYRKNGWVGNVQKEDGLIRMEKAIL